MKKDLVRYCPGSASGSPGWMTESAAELQAAKDTTTINKLVKVDSIDKPVCYPHIGGKCKRCERPN